MKKLIDKLFLFLTVSLIFNSSLLIQNCQSQWVWQNPLPHGNTVNVIKFIDKNTGWYFSGISQNFKTINGGLNWIKDIFPTNQTIVSAKYFTFDSANSLFILGGTSGAIVKSTNKGNNWVLVNSPAGYNITDFHFFDMHNGFVALTDLYKTTNGGTNWSYIPTNTGCSYNIISFANNSTGWLFQTHIIPAYFDSHYYLLKTSNSGIDWMQVFQKDLFGTLCGGFNNFIFKDTDNGIVDICGNINISTNSGLNWSNNFNGGIFDFIDGNTGFVANGVKFSKTTNFGNNWRDIDSVYTKNIQKTCMEVLDSSSIILGGYSGDIIKTTNGGINWSFLHNNFIRNDIRKITCFDSLNLYALAPNKYFLKSGNGGVNWFCTDTNMFGSDNIKSIFFLNKDTGWAYNEYGRIYKTNNGGNNWSVSNLLPQYPFACFKIFNSGIGYINANTWVYKTTNYGNNWGPVYNLTDNIIRASFPDELTGYAVSSHNIYKTTNGGINWNIIESNSYTNYYYNICFYNANTGFCGNYTQIIVPPYPTLYYLNKTTNGGVNWVHSGGSSGEFYAGEIYFVNSNIIYASDRNGGLKLSTNNGISWTSEIISQSPIYSITTYNKNIWVAGGAGMIMKGNQIVPVGVKNISIEIPISFSLKQNFPNPFNPVTRIRYELPRSGSVKLVVYDVMGREVETLVNERQAAGSYEAVWDGTRLASGVYLYRLTAEGYRETRKMLMIR